VYLHRNKYSLCTWLMTVKLVRFERHNSLIYTLTLVPTGSVMESKDYYFSGCRPVQTLMKMPSIWPSVLILSALIYTTPLSRSRQRLLRQLNFTAVFLHHTHMKKRAGSNIYPLVTRTRITHSCSLKVTNYLRK
jgi:hypothetical protein